MRYAIIFLCCIGALSPVHAVENPAQKTARTELLKQKMPQGLIVSESLAANHILFGGEYGQVFQLDLANKSESWDGVRISGVGLVTGISHSRSQDQSQKVSTLISTSTGEIYRSSGSNLQDDWQILYKPESDRINPLFDVAQIAPEHYIAIGAFGTVLESQDNGISWQALSEEIDNPDLAHLYNIILLSKQQQEKFQSIAMVVGEFGQVFLLNQDENQNIEWKKIPNEVDTTLFDGHYLSSRWVVISGIGGVLLVYDLNTEELFQSELCVQKSIYSVSPDDTERNLLLAGEGGYLVRLSLLDGGLGSPPIITCQSLKKGNETFSGIIIQDEKLFLMSSEGVSIHNAASFLPDFSTPQDIQW